jgi:hypothetical protein
MSALARTGAWQEVIQVFLQLAAEDPEEQSVLRLAMALGRFFPSCHLFVLSFTMRGPETPSWEGAEWSDEASRLLAQEEVEAFTALFKRLDQNIEAFGYSLRFTTVARPPWVLVYSPRSSSSAEREIGIVIENTDPGLYDEMADRFVWLRRYLEGIPALATAFFAVSRAQEAGRAWKLARIFDLRGAVANFVHSWAASATRRLELGQEVEAKLRASLAVSADREHLPLARDLAEATLQGLLGDGQDLRPGDDGGGAATDSLPFLKTLREIEEWRLPLPEDEELRQSLWWLNRSLQAAIGGDVPKLLAARVVSEDLSNEPSQGVLELAQLAFWSSVHQDALAWLREDHLAISESEWGTWRSRIRSTLADLEKVLENRFQHEDGAGLRVKLLPAWLRLWFCSELARVACKRDKPGAWGRWQLWAHLAYTTRETLRALTYGRRADYRFQPVDLAVALRTVVEHHAIHVIELPSDPDIRALLHEVSQMNAADGYLFAAGHLQHVLEVYIAGQFLCGVATKLDGTTWTMEEILASRSSWPPGDLSREEFRKAFSLAALLHDVGRLLLPRSPQPTTRWARVDRALVRELAEVDTGLKGAVGRLMEHCVAELRQENYFDPHVEPAIEAWIAECQERGEADPALVSAWFLHRLCLNLEGLQSSTVQQAVRAVLLHRLVTQSIQVDVDPAAALLVACDQIFTWNVAPVGSRPGEAGHSIQALAADLRPSVSPFRGLELYGGGPQRLQLELKRDPAKGRLQAEISKESPDGPRPDWPHSWPHFVLELQEPESLETPIYWIWLSLAQNLGRIGGSRKRNWAPVVTIKSRVDGQLSTFQLLRRIADRSSLRPALERWLDTVSKEKLHRERVVKRNASADNPDAAAQFDCFEEITLGPLDRLLYREDICDIFPELDTLAKEIRSGARRRI